MFMIQCDNQGCMQQQAARLDISNNEVLCAECGGVIKNITPFAKRQLKSLGQTTKRAKTAQTYSVKCDTCQTTGAPIMDKDTITCGSCKKEIKNLSVPFKNLLKEALKNEPK